MAKSTPYRNSTKSCSWDSETDRQKKNPLWMVDRKKMHSLSISLSGWKDFSWPLDYTAQLMDSAGKAVPNM